MNDEFYIGYEPDMPARLAKRIRRVARGLVALALVTPAVLVFTEGRFAPGVFEYRPGADIQRPHRGVSVSRADG